MKDKRKARMKELEKYFESYGNGEFDEDDSVIDELSEEYASLERELLVK